MTWEPLVRVFCAESLENGVEIAHTFRSPDWETAELFAISQGWTLVGGLVDEIEQDDEFIAQMEKTLTGPVLH